MQPAINEQAVLSAWLRVKSLVSSGGDISVEELRSLELALRPVAGVSEIQQAIVPLLDRFGLPGLAMAWDGEPQTVTDEWLRARFERWLALRSPEFAFLTLAQLQGRQTQTNTDRARAQAVLDAERAIRAPLLESNLAAISDTDPGLHVRLVTAPRLSVALRPIGTGLAEYASGGGAPLQLWAATADEAAAEADRLVTRCAARDVWFLAGVGDGTLPGAAARVVMNDSTNALPSRCVHLIEAHLVRLRALLEVVDFAAALRAHRIRLHAGAGAVETLTHLLVSLPPLEEDAVLGGDTLSLSILETAAGRAAAATG